MTLEELVAATRPKYTEQYEDWERAGEYAYDPDLWRYMEGAEPGDTGSWQRRGVDELGQESWEYGAPTTTDDALGAMLAEGVLPEGVDLDKYIEQLARREAIGQGGYGRNFDEATLPFIRQLDPDASEEEVFQAVQRVNARRDAPGQYMSNDRITQAVAEDYLSNKFGTPVNLEELIPGYREQLEYSDKAASNTGFNLREALPYLAMFFGPWAASVLGPAVAGAFGAEAGATGAVAAEGVGGGAAVSGGAGGASGVVPASLSTGAGAGATAGTTGAVVPTTAAAKIAAQLGVSGDALALFNTPWIANASSAAVTNAALTAVRGGSAEDVLKAAGYGAVGGGLGTAVSSVVSPLVNQAVGSALPSWATTGLTSGISGGATSGIMAGLTGGDIGQAALTGGISGGVGGATSSLVGGATGSRDFGSVVGAASGAAATGRDPIQAAISAIGNVGFNRLVDSLPSSTPAAPAGGRPATLPAGQQRAEFVDEATNVLVAQLEQAIGRPVTSDERIELAQALGNTATDVGGGLGLPPTAEQRFPGLEDGGDIPARDLYNYAIQNGDFGLASTILDNLRTSYEGDYASNWGSDISARDLIQIAQDSGDSDLAQRITRASIEALRTQIPTDSGSVSTGSGSIPAIDAGPDSEGYDVCPEGYASNGAGGCVLSIPITGGECPEGSAKDASGMCVPIYTETPIDFYEPEPERPPVDTYEPEPERPPLEIDISGGQCAEGSVRDASGQCVPITDETPPDTPCAEGFSPDPVTGLCTPIEEVTECEEGFSPDPVTGLCISNEDCPQGTTKNTITGECESQECPAGQVRNLNTGQCETPTTECPPGQIRGADGRCRSQCPPGYVYDPTAMGNCRPSGGGGGGGGGRTSENLAGLGLLAMLPLLGKGTEKFEPPKYDFTAGIFNPFAYSQYGRTMETGQNLPAPTTPWNPNYYNEQNQNGNG